MAQRRYVITSRDETLYQTNLLSLADQKFRALVKQGARHSLELWDTHTRGLMRRWAEPASPLAEDPTFTPVQDVIRQSREFISEKERCARRAAQAFAALDAALSETAQEEGTTS